MRQFLICLTALLLFGWAASAQRGLQTRAVFQGQVVPKSQMEVTEVRSGDITNYKLDYYKGIHFQTNGTLAREVAALVEADAVAGESAETEKVGDFLTYALVQPKPLRKRNRYLCYQARRIPGDAWIITILYLEGTATLEDLRSMFDKQKDPEK